MVGSVDKTLYLYEGAYHDEVMNAFVEGVAGTSLETAIAQREILDKAFADVEAWFSSRLSPELKPDLSSELSSEFMSVGS